MITLGKANIGIDFAGGVMVAGTFRQPIGIDDLRDAVRSEFPDAQVNEVKDFSAPNAFIIKTKSPGNRCEQEH